MINEKVRHAVPIFLLGWLILSSLGAGYCFYVLSSGQGTPEIDSFITTFIFTLIGAASLVWMLVWWGIQKLILSRKPWNTRLYFVTIGGLSGVLASLVVLSIINLMFENNGELWISITFVFPAGLIYGIVLSTMKFVFIRTN